VSKEGGIQCFGRIWISRGKQHFLGRNRIALLEKIDEFGSINHAAKAMNISYKKAWEIVNSLKKVSGYEILECQTGGRGGGGSQLTDYARNLVSVYRSMELEHKKFIDEITSRINSHIS
jgi:molybdate transport system regulatory protein